MNTSYYCKHYHCIPPVYGGVNVFVKRLMLALCKKNLISGAFKGQNYEGIPKKFDYLLDTFPKHSRSLFILPEIFYLYSVFKNYSIIHTHSSFTTIFGIWLIHVLQRKPVVCTVHNQMIDKEYSYLNIIDRYILRLMAEDRTVQFITVNENAKNDLINHGLNFANPIIVMPAYIPPVEIGEPSDYLSKDLLDFSMNENPTLLFYAESFAMSFGKEIYGTSTIIDLFLSLKVYFPNVRLIFCMANVNAEYEKLNDLKKLVRDSGYVNDVFWQIGALSEMWPLLKSSVALIRPTTTDGDSVMVREALSYGLPVITSNVTNRPQGCIVYQLDNKNDLLNKTIALLNKPYRKVIPQQDYTDSIINIYNTLINCTNV